MLDQVIQKQGAVRPLVNGPEPQNRRQLHKRILQRLDRLEQAKTLEYLDVSGFNFHALRGFRPPRYTIHVNGPWCITFEFDDGNAYRIELEQYH